jgi:hypothetical protein
VDGLSGTPFRFERSCLPSVLDEGSGVSLRRYFLTIRLEIGFVASHKRRALGKAVGHFLGPQQLAVNFGLEVLPSAPNTDYVDQCRT